jgi:thymidylate synthase, flavin-dependent
VEKSLNVELIAMTQPYSKEPRWLDSEKVNEASLHGMTTPEDIISYCARVSNPGNQENFETSEKLIRYLLKKSHWSPFEMVDMVFEVKTTRDIGRQILRHRSFSFQEFSQRYAELELNPDDIEIRECRLQDDKNRQNSTPTDDEFLKNEWGRLQWGVFWKVREYYKRARELLIAKEQARALLPEGLTPSTMYMKGSVRSWFHYCLVRMHPGTQKEHRLIAQEVWKNMQEEFSFFRSLDMEKLSIEYQKLFEQLLEECYGR